MRIDLTETTPLAVGRLILVRVRKIQLELVVFRRARACLLYTSDAADE